MSSIENPPRKMIRLEKDSYPDDIELSKNSGFLIRSNATIERDRALSRMKSFEGKKNQAVEAETQKNKFEKKLDIAVGGESDERDKLMKNHAKSSMGSPFLSGTPRFTTGQNSQLSYMESNLKRGRSQVATIQSTARAFDNPHNSRESEMLLPHGVRKEERIGILHVKPVAGGVRPLFIDKTGERPQLFIGRKALARFQDLSTGGKALNSSKDPSKK